MHRHFMSSIPAYLVKHGFLRMEVLKISTIWLVKCPFKTNITILTSTTITKLFDCSLGRLINFQRSVATSPMSRRVFCYPQDPRIITNPLQWNRVKTAVWFHDDQEYSLPMVLYTHPQDFCLKCQNTQGIKTDTVPVLHRGQGILRLKKNWRWKPIIPS